MTYPSTIKDAQRVRVYTGSDFASLSVDPTVEARSVQRALGPGKSTATLVTLYGDLSYGGTFRLVAAKSFEERCVRVTVTVDRVEHTVFEGIVVADSIQPDGTFAGITADVPTGRVLHLCEGLEYLLERIHPGHTVTAAYGQVADLFAFNGRGTAMEPNCSAQPSTDASGTSHVFAWGPQATYWSALQTLQYVLRFASSQTPYTWSVTGEHAYLDAVRLQVDPRGKSLRQVINECIRTQDGFGWYITVSGHSCSLNVVSLTDASIQDANGEEAVPANTDTFALTEIMQTDREVQTPVITRVADSSYSAVEVYSEPLRVTCWLGMAGPEGNEGFVPDWTEQEEAAFIAATDSERAGDDLRHVYARYRLPENWNLCDRSGVLVSPSLDPIACQPNHAVPAALAVPAVVFERTVPVPGSSEQRPATVLLPHPESGVLLSADRPASDALPAVGVEMSDTGPGLTLRTRNNVVLAPAAFPGVSAYRPVYDTSRLRVLVSYYTHTLVRCRRNAHGGEGVKRIYIPGYHLWVSYQTGTQIVRDDTHELRRLATMMATWYGRTRNTVQYSARTAPGAVRVGRLVSQCYTGGGHTPIGTVVTSETWHWDDSGRPSYSMQTDHANIDFTRISRRTVVAQNREITRRIRRLEERVQGVSVREPMGDSTGPLLSLANDTQSGQWRVGAQIAAPTPFRWVDTSGQTASVPYMDGKVSVWLSLARTTQERLDLRVVTNAATDPNRFAIGDGEYLKHLPLLVYLGWFRATATGTVTQIVSVFNQRDYALALAPFLREAGERLTFDNARPDASTLFSIYDPLAATTDFNPSTRRFEGATFIVQASEFHTGTFQPHDIDFLLCDVNAWWGGMFSVGPEWHEPGLVPVARLRTDGLGHLIGFERLTKIPIGAGTEAMTGVLQGKNVRNGIVLG